jgi:hypothetical protein
MNATSLQQHEKGNEEIPQSKYVRILEVGFGTALFLSLIFLMTAIIKR